MSGRQASQGTVTLEVRQPAATVRILGVSYLVHELWISNGGATAVTIDAVSVLDDRGTLEQIGGATLANRVGRPDLPRTHQTPLLVEPTRAAVVYFWVSLTDVARLPQRIWHRAELAAGDGSGLGRRLQVSGGETRVSPPGDAEVVDAPLRGERWAAVYDPAMIGGHRTAIYTVEGRTRIPGRFAIDFIRLSPAGRAHVDRTSRPPNWNGFGAEVLAVNGARVAMAVDGHLDADASGKPRESITRDNAAGNFVALELGSGRYVFYEHLQQGSIAVKVGDRVTRGQVIARVGSSGSVSSGPHLHFHISDTPSTLGAEGVPFVLRAFNTSGAFASIAAFANGDAPLSLRASIERRREFERPAPNAVVDFASRP